MVNKKSLIIEQYLKMIKDIETLIEKNIFPEFWDVIDIIFYFSYNFLKPDEDVQTIDNMLEINIGRQVGDDPQIRDNQGCLRFNIAVLGFYGLLQNQFLDLILCSKNKGTLFLVK
jgi:hypothetical protein